ncbi:unnamed protein product [Rhizophagus irregularis]|nr:unnamed protein product [Rhizophagus irregularis]
MILRALSVNSLSYLTNHTLEIRLYYRSKHQSIEKKLLNPQQYVTKFLIYFFLSSVAFASYSTSLIHSFVTKPKFWWRSYFESQEIDVIYESNSFVTWNYN